MEIIKPSVTVTFPNDMGNPLRWIELCGRVCYKSESKITDDSASKFIQMFYKRKHFSPLEQYRFIVLVSSSFDYAAIRSIHPKFIEMTDFDGRKVISGSPRAFYELWNTVKGTENECALTDVLKAIKEHLGEKDFDVLFNHIEFNKKWTKEILKSRVITEDELTPNEYRYHAWFSARFICDRGVSHEIVRHRVFSFLQESQRYVDYNKKGLAVIKPTFFEEGTESYEIWCNSMLKCESDYNTLRNMGVPPERARTVLPNSAKTEIIVTGTVSGWINFFELRLSPAAHPQMRELSEDAIMTVIARPQRKGLHPFVELAEDIITRKEGV